MNISIGTVWSWVSFRRRWLLLLAVVALASGCYWLGESFVVRGAPPQAAATVVPFTLTINLYDFTKNPQGTLNGQQVVARRSDGSTAQIGPFLGKVGRQFGLTVRQLTFADGHGMMIVDDARARATWPSLAGRRLTQWLDSFEDPPKDCLKQPGFAQLRGSSTILGEKVDVIGLPAAGGRTIVQWSDPKLGCETIQYEIQEPQPSGGTKVGFASRPVSVKLGEPDPALFDEEPTYSEMRPSEIIQTELAKMGVPDNDVAEKDGQRLDKAYLGEGAR